jgi:hypothetical protein
VTRDRGELDLLRAGLAALAAIAGTTGVRALVSPGSFYRDFPGCMRPDEPTDADSTVAGSAR